MNRTRRWVLFGIIIGLLLLINFWSIFFLHTPDMHVLTGQSTIVYFQTEVEAAEDVFQLAEHRAETLARLLGIQLLDPIEIFVYDDQAMMQSKKYGRIGSLLGLDWYIGDNRGDQVILTSPVRPGEVHERDTVQNAVLHELVHALNHRLNPKLSYWLDNGLAGYLSDQYPPENLAGHVPIPTIQQTKVEGPLAPLQFANLGGYEYSYTYIDYLAQTYDWEQVQTLIRTGNYMSALGVSEEQVYAGWVRFLHES